TWASYLLMGNPLSKLFQKESKVPDLSRSTLDTDMVLMKYPFPIAAAYSGIITLNGTERSNNSVKFEKLYNAYEDTLLFVSTLIFANYEFLNINKPIVFDLNDILGTINSTRQILNMIGVLKMEMLIPNLADTMNNHKDEMYKIISWKREYDRGEINSGNIEGYVISLQYLLERLLIDTEYLKNYGFFKINEPGYAHLSLYGISRYHSIKEITLPTQTDTTILEELTIQSSSLTGKCIFYIPVKRIFLDLSPFFDIIEMDEGNSSKELSYIFKKYDTSKSKPVIVKGRKPGIEPRSNII
ncbi:MAG: hypothetical protein OEV78_04695, partial [Spirochaetia bacterium]|nr:hypothetical protein [Spirochaetia bacterium]